MHDTLSDSVGAFNRVFHLVLLRPAEKPLILIILERLHELSERHGRKHLTPLGRDDHAHQEHHELLGVWIAHAQRKVVALTIVHIGKALDNLRLQLNVDDKTLRG